MADSDLNRNTNATPVYLINPADGSRYASSGAGAVYQLATNQNLASGAFTTPVAGIAKGNYIWDVSFTGAGTIKLQSLGADGSTWRDVASMTAPGTFAGEIAIGGNATVRLLAGAAFTAVSSSIS